MKFIKKNWRKAKKKIIIIIKRGRKVKEGEHGPT